MLEIFNQELKARGTCLSSLPFGKNFKFDSKYTGSALYFSTASRGENPKSFVKCIFSKGEHWSNKCNIITDSITSKEFLQNNKLCFRYSKKDNLSRNCKRSKTCFYCKGCHNSVVCMERKRDTHESQETDSKNSAESSTNLASGVSTVLLQTIDLIVEGTMCEKQIKVKVLFDQSSQRSHVTKRVTDLLKLKGVSKQSIGIKTFGDKKSKNSILENVFVKLKNDKNEKFEIKALCTNLICLSINNQPVCDIQSITNRL